jgi:hypothetical protein
MTSAVNPWEIESQPIVTYCPARHICLILFGRTVAPLVVVMAKRSPPGVYDAILGSAALAILPIYERTEYRKSTPPLPLAMPNAHTTPSVQVSTSFSSPRVTGQAGCGIGALYGLCLLLPEARHHRRASIRWDTKTHPFGNRCVHRDARHNVMKASHPCPGRSLAWSHGIAYTLHGRTVSRGLADQWDRMGRQTRSRPSCRACRPRSTMGASASSTRWRRAGRRDRRAAVSPLSCDGAPRSDDAMAMTS